MISEKSEPVVGGSNRILAVDDEEDPAFGLKAGSSTCGFNVNDIIYPKLISSNYRMGKYGIAIGTGRGGPSASNATAIKGKNGAGGNN